MDDRDFVGLYDTIKSSNGVWRSKTGKKIPAEFFEEFFTDVVVPAFAVECFENVEVFLFAGVSVSAEKLVENVLGIDEAFADHFLVLVLLEFLVVEAAQLVKVVKKFRLEVADIIETFSCNLVENKENILVVFGVTGLFQEKKYVILRNLAPSLLQRVCSGIFKAMVSELFFNVVKDTWSDGGVLFSLVLVDAVSKVDASFVCVFGGDVYSVDVLEAAEIVEKLFLEAAVVANKGFSVNYLVLLLVSTVFTGHTVFYRFFAHCGETELLAVCSNVHVFGGDVKVASYEVLLVAIVRFLSTHERDTDGFV